MLRITRVRQALVVTGITSLVLASSLVAGAVTTTGSYNAADAKLVPASFTKTTIQVATDATYAPDESMSGTTMVGFDVDLMNAIGKTLGVKINENNVTFDSILAGIGAGRYQIANSSFTDTKAREKQVYFVDYFQAGEAVYAKSSSSVLDSQVAGYVVSQSKGAFKLVGNAIEVAPYGIGTPKTAAGKGLAMAIKAAVKTLIANGTYGAILAKWGVSSGALPTSKIVLDGATS